jgi:hypothetical protein
LASSGRGNEIQIGWLISRENSGYDLNKAEVIRRNSDSAFGEGQNVAIEVERRRW